MPSLSDRLSESNARNLLAAYEAGERVAEAIAVGDTFDGAFPAAERHGLTRGTPEYRMFTDGYLYALGRRFPHGVYTDVNGRIVR